MDSRLLEGKRVLIMGVADKHSIAWGIAEQMHAHGAQLAFSYQDEPRGRLQRNLRDLVSTLDGAADPLMVPCDVTDDSAIDRAFAAVNDRWGALDGLVHAIAYAHRDDLNKPFTEISRTGYKLAMEISAFSLTAVSRAARPLMVAAGGGSIMTLTYNAVEKAVPGYSTMAPAKAALETGMRYLSVDLGPQKIRVNAISAGPIRTLSGSAVRGITLLRKFTEEMAPLRENVTIEDVGDTAVFLASDLSRMITGMVLFVDSGTHVLAGQVAAIPEEMRGPGAMFD
ncbi:MAG: enoyl-ACP reductase [Dehalococcoidia bacterium]